MFLEASFWVIAQRAKKLNCRITRKTRESHEYFIRLQYSRNSRFFRVIRQFLFFTRCAIEPVSESQTRPNPETAPEAGLDE